MLPRTSVVWSALLFVAEAWAYGRLAQTGGLFSSVDSAIEGQLNLASSSKMGLKTAPYDQLLIIDGTCCVFLELEAFPLLSYPQTRLPQFRYRLFDFRGKPTSALSNTILAGSGADQCPFAQ